ncbi:MAG: UDP-N-acetylmuramoyl-L-alanine--D-glutamate ligase, partial [Sphingobacteriaceae bacterium]
MARQDYIVILGAGESGTGAAVLAKKQGFEVFVSDAGEIPEVFKRELSEYEIPYEENKHSETIIFKA